jgi:hypothetical protein
MKDLADRLVWVRLIVSEEIPRDPIGDQIVKDEINCSIAIVEMLGMRSLLERLEEVRDYVNGSKTDKELAMTKVMEAMAIAEVLPEVQIILPSAPDPKGF